MKSIVFACVSIDIPRWRSDSERLRAQLPLMSRMVLREGERTGSLSSSQYLAALSEYYDRFVYRFEKKPEVLSISERESDAITYTTMWGPNELVVSGVVRDYSISPRLPEIKVPVLCVCGRFDEATPEAHEYFTSLISGARCRIFEESAHHPHLNEENDFLKVIGDFISEN